MLEAVELSPPKKCIKFTQHRNPTRSLKVKKLWSKPTAVTQTEKRKAGDEQGQPSSTAGIATLQQWAQSCWDSAQWVGPPSSSAQSHPRAPTSPKSSLWPLSPSYAPSSISPWPSLPSSLLLAHSAKATLASWTYQAPFCLRTFTLIVTSAWNVLPPVAEGSERISSLLRYHLLREAFTDHPHPRLQPTPIPVLPISPSPDLFSSIIFITRGDNIALTLLIVCPPPLNINSTG